MTNDHSALSLATSRSSSTPTPTVLTPLSEASDSQQPSHLKPSSSSNPQRQTGHADKPRKSGTDLSDVAQASPAFSKPSDSEESDLEDEDTMVDVRPPMHRPTDGRSGLPLLKDERGRPSYDSPHGSARPAFHSRRSTFRSRSPDFDAQSATKRKYTYAAFFLGLSLVSFVIQTETAVYIQHDLGWNKAYCMLYFTHGSWSLLWPAMLLILRVQKRHVPWKSFWRRHTYLLRTTAQMVESGDLHLTSRESQKSPIPYILRTTAFVTTALTVAGGSWYVAVDLTSASDLTAIYNCSAFFAYAFSIPLLRDKLRFDKIMSVGVAIAGVLIVAYGDSGQSKDDASRDPKCKAPEDGEAKNRLLGNIIIGIGSVLYGLYEVLYKKYACPPEGASPGRGMVFAMTFGSLIGSFTLLVLWIPLPILHFMGIETFAFPRGEAAWMLLISVLANASTWFRSWWNVLGLKRC